MPLPPRTNVKVLNPEVERLLFQEKVITEELEGLMDGLSEPQFQWTPQPGTWSMGQCIDHLNATDRTFLSNIEAAIAKGRAAGMVGEGPYTYGFFSRLMHRMTIPPVKRRFPAPAMFRPGMNKNKAAVLMEWKTNHERMKAVMESANGLDMQRIKVQSPASKLVKVNLGMAFWILTAHEKRHLWQARNVRNNLGFPPA
jgi:hypothetical protein